MRRNPWVHGMIAGALGYAVVALFFALLNLAAGNSPFETAFLLGRAIGAEGPGPDSVVGAVLAANGLHLVISLGAGIAAAWLAEELEHHHAIWYGVLLAFLGGFFLSVVAAGMLAAEIGGIASWPQVTVANGLAAAVIGGYLGHLHRQLLRELREEFGS